MAALTAFPGVVIQLKFTWKPRPTKICDYWGISALFRKAGCNQPGCMKTLTNGTSLHSRSILKMQMANAESPYALFIIMSHNSLNDLVILQARAIICEYLSVVTKKLS